MKRNTCRLPVLLLVALGGGASWSSFGQGALTPPGAPAPTMKTLQQVEPRTPISSAPFTITQPGSYYLTTNLTVSGGDAITIAANGVTLDLNGWTIQSTTDPASGTAILLSGSPGERRQDVTILNGHIQGGVTNDGSGVYSGPGFGYGINYSGSAPLNTPPNAPVNVLVRGVSVSGCRFDGIDLGNGNSMVVEHCTVRTVGRLGIFASTVKTSSAIECGDIGIWGDQVSDCQGQSTSSAGIFANTIQNCSGYSYGAGNGVRAYSSAIGCYGQSSSGYGVFATTAQNCYGFSNGSGNGVFANIAQNCYGQSSSGAAGLYAQNAAFCVGYRFGGRAIWATIANGCYATGGTNLITYKYNMP